VLWVPKIPPVDWGAAPKSDAVDAVLPKPPNGDAEDAPNKLPPDDAAPNNPVDGVDDPNRPPEVTPPNKDAEFCCCAPNRPPNGWL
jgi:hypothetical protein